MDQTVDGYGIHQYPWQGTPQARKAALSTNALAVCGTGAPGKAKPCWITEWGLNNKDMGCPLDDEARAWLARETMNNYREAARSGILAGAIYFSWSADAWARQPSASSVYRCGAETATARAALQP